MSSCRARIVWHASAVALWLIASTTLYGDEPLTKRGPWLIQRETQSGHGVWVYTIELTLHPREEARPALRYRFVPDEFDQVDGNAAIYYLKAMGFLQQEPAREQLMAYEKQAWERVQEERKAGNSEATPPPYSWEEMAPSQLPLEEVKKYLAFVSFQPQYLREAARRRYMDFDRQLRTDENPLGYLLPDIQEMRMLARIQSVRCKVAIAENRLDDAIEILGQLYAMARHLGEDDTVVANYVGEYCASIAWENALQLVQHRDPPNLYCAFASLPDPLIDTRRSIAFERQMLYLQFPMLREVDETPRPAGYWQDFVDRLAPKYFQWEAEQRSRLASQYREPAAARTALIGFLAFAYPDAKRYLIEQCQLPREQVDAYPTAQVVFLAVVRYYDRMRDEVSKWSFVPFERGPARADDQWSAKSVVEQSGETGWFARPTHKLMSSAGAFPALSVQSNRTAAMLQTIEAIRMYGAAHDGQLPSDLSQLPVPAPTDPTTGQAFAYSYADDNAVLSWHGSRLQHRIVLHFAKEAGQ